MRTNIKNSMKILFLHGLESRPGGSKAAYLQSLGHEVLNPHLPKSSFEESVRIAQRVSDNENPDIIIGSSRGGAVAMAIDAQNARKILIAPAWKNYGVPCTTGPVHILHSESDKVVPFEDTQELFRENTGVKVISCDDDHRMKKPATLNALSQILL